MIINKLEVYKYQIATHFSSIINFGLTCEAVIYFRRKRIINGKVVTLPLASPFQIMQRLNGLNI